ncbi:MAG: hypothetical protein GX267_04765 [Fibrobacter sp.]|jgi:hypothetical protein|nr:hypothetical protein [Fibrobacter sp.]
MPNEHISLSFRDIIDSLRCGDYSVASSRLNETLQCMETELKNRKVAPKQLQKLLYSLETLFTMQKMEDWVAVADILEFEFTGIWKELMQS